MRIREFVAGMASTLILLTMLVPGQSYGQRVPPGGTDDGSGTMASTGGSTGTGGTIDNHGWAITISGGRTQFRPGTNGAPDTQPYGPVNGGFDDCSGTIMTTFHGTRTEVPSKRFVFNEVSRVGACTIGFLSTPHDSMKTEETRP